MNDLQGKGNLFDGNAFFSFYSSTPAQLYAVPEAEEHPPPLPKYLPPQVNLAKDLWIMPIIIIYVKERSYM